jgi:thymidine kinase
MSPEGAGRTSDAPVSLPSVIRTQPHAGGWLEVVCGPMFSGKSEELIRRLRRAEIAGQRALIVKPLIDDRYDVGHVVSHAGAKMRAVTAETSDEVRRLATGYDAVGIDEVQFFDDGIVGAIDALVRGGARVVAGGLAQDFRGLPFGAMPTLLCVAEFVDKLEAVCHRCGGPATMTQRLVDGLPAPFDGDTIQVGALDSYEARCRACHSVSQTVSQRVGTLAQTA